MRTCKYNVITISELAKPKRRPTKANSHHHCKMCQCLPVDSITASHHSLRRFICPVAIETTAPYQVHEAKL